MLCTCIIEKHLVKVMYIAIVLAILFYAVLSIGALAAIAAEAIKKNKEFPLTAGTVLENLDHDLLIPGLDIGWSLILYYKFTNKLKQMPAIRI